MLVTLGSHTQIGHLCIHCSDKNLTVKNLPPQIFITNAQNNSTATKRFYTSTNYICVHKTFLHMHIMILKLNITSQAQNIHDP